MPVFVHLWCTSSATGSFNTKKDAKSLNNILMRLQEKGAKIIDVKATLSPIGSRLTSGNVVLYIIIYEAPEPIVVKG